MKGFESLYILIYAIMFLITFFVINSKSISRKSNIILIIIFSFFWLLLFGTRSFDIGTDTNNYVLSFELFIQKGVNVGIEDYKDLGYFFFLYLISIISHDSKVYLFLFSTLYFIFFIFFITRLKIKNLYLFFFLFCSFFFFKSMGINIMRQGVSIMLFLTGLSYFVENKKKTSYLFFFIAFLFHASILVVILFTLIARNIKTIKLPIVFFISAIILSYNQIGYHLIIDKIPFLKLLIKDRIEDYSKSNTDYEIGFRLSFVIFNLIFAVIGYLFYKNPKIANLPNYSFYLFLYLFLSANFFLMFNFEYSDRSGLISWIFIPFLFIPYIDNYIKFGKAKVLIISLLIFIFFNLIFFK